MQRSRCMGSLSRFVIVLLVGVTGMPQAAVVRPTLFDLIPGSSAFQLPGGFKNYACGGNGGPAGRPIAGWQDFRSCPAQDGLHEIVFDYDDRAEQAARASGNPAAAWGLGTTLDYFPIVASALFDDAGVLQALRLATDARPDKRKDPFALYRPYGEHYLLQLYLMDRFGMTATDCKNLPLAPGQSPVFGMVTNRTCDHRDATTGWHYHIEAKFYRRRGEHDVDADTGRASQGQFLSETRAEISATAD